MTSDSREFGWWRSGTLEELMRKRWFWATIEAIVDEELAKGRALGAAAIASVCGTVRAGYRHGKRLRTLTTSSWGDDDRDAAGANRGRRGAPAPSGAARSSRATSGAPSGSTKRFFGVYLSGTNTRRLARSSSPRCCARWRAFVEAMR